MVHVCCELCNVISFSLGLLSDCSICGAAFVHRTGANRASHNPSRRASDCSSGPFSRARAGTEPCARTAPQPPRASPVVAAVSRPPAEPSGPTPPPITASSEKVLHRQGGQRASLRAPRRRAGDRARTGRHAAQRRRQGEPVFSARLQSRPRHRSGALPRRHAAQYAHAWPCPGLRGQQFPDSRTLVLRPRPQRAV